MYEIFNRYKNFYNNSPLQIRIIAFFLAATLPFLLLSSWMYSIKPQDPCVFADWLINYQDGGFKRRGLPGTMLIFIYDQTRISLSHLTFIIYASAYTAFFITFYSIIKDKKTNFSVTSLILLPITFLFFIYNPISIGRKEILLFLLLGLLVRNLYTSSKFTWKQTVLLSVGYIVCILSHELSIFYIPYFFVAILIHYKQTNQKVEYGKILTFLCLAVLSTVAVLLTKGINNGQTQTILLSRGIPPHTLSSLLSSSDNSKAMSHMFLNIFIHGKYSAYIEYVIPILIGILYFIYIGVNNSFQNKLSLKTIVLTLGGLWLWSLPLFDLASDWGRWINIHFTLLLILFIQMLPEKNNSHPTLLKNKFYATQFLLVLGMLLWGMPFGGDGFSFEYSFFNRIFFYFSKYAQPYLPILK